MNGVETAFGPTSLRDLLSEQEFITQVQSLETSMHALQRNGYYSHLSSLAAIDTHLERISGLEPLLCQLADGGHDKHLSSITSRLASLAQMEQRTVGLELASPSMVDVADRVKRMASELGPLTAGLSTLDSLSQSLRGLGDMDQISGLHSLRERLQSSELDEKLSILVGGLDVIEGHSTAMEKMIAVMNQMAELDGALDVHVLQLELHGIAGLSPDVLDRTKSLHNALLKLESVGGLISSVSDTLSCSDDLASLRESLKVEPLDSRVKTLTQSLTSLGALTQSLNGLSQSDALEAVDLLRKELSVLVPISSFGEKLRQLQELMNGVETAFGPTSLRDLLSEQEFITQVQSLETSMHALQRNGYYSHLSSLAAIDTHLERISGLEPLLCQLADGGHDKHLSSITSRLASLAQMEQRTVGLELASPSMVDVADRVKRMASELGPLTAGLSTLDSLSQSLRGLGDMDQISGLHSLRERLQSSELDEKLSILVGGLDVIEGHSTAMEKMIAVMNQMAELDGAMNVRDLESVISRFKSLQISQPAQSQLRNLSESPSEVEPLVLEAHTALRGDTEAIHSSLRSLQLAISEVDKQMKSLKWTTPKKSTDQFDDLLDLDKGQIENLQASVRDLMIRRQQELADLTEVKKAWLKLIKSPYHQGLPPRNRLASLSASRRPVTSQGARSRSKRESRSGGAGLDEGGFQ